MKSVEHQHNCVDYPDHSDGAHLCECGVMWQGEHDNALQQNVDRYDA